MGAQRMINRIHALLASGMLASAVACGGGSGSDGVVGPKLSESGFTATVSGALAATHAGAAVYLVAPGSGGAFGMNLAARESSALITVSYPGGSLPAVGTHPIADYLRPEQIQSMFSMSYVTAGNGAAYQSTGGTVTITSTGGGHVKGTFNLTARNVSCGCASPPTVTVTGTFDAVG